MSTQTVRAATASASRYVQQLARHWAQNNEAIFDATSADFALRGNNRFAFGEAPLPFAWSK